ncbi:MAG: hypothetical protein ACYCZR_06065 [Burkholderiales bacterium]
MAIRLKGGRYYLVKYTGMVDGKTKYQWTALTKDLTSSTLMASAITNGDIRIIGYGACEKELKAFIAKSFRSCKRRSEDRNIPNNITLDMLLAMAEKDEWRCSVSGVKYDLRQLSKHHGRPFAPSIDRIKPELGYIEGNVRLVCLATNYAMNQWGAEIFGILARSFIKNSRKKNIDNFEADMGDIIKLHGKPSHDNLNN